MHVPTRFVRLLCAAAFWGALAVDSATAQQKQLPPAGDEYVVKVYPVTDLVVPRPDYPYQPSEIPTAGSVTTRPGKGEVVPLGGGLGGGGLGSGFGGGGGGGFFQVADVEIGGSGVNSQKQGWFGPAGSHRAARRSRGLRFGIDDLVSAIVSTVAPETWQEVGGRGVITPLGGMLVIKQTPPAHREIGQLLEAIRSQSGTLKNVVIEAHWLLLEPEDLAKLVDAEKPKSEQVTPRIVDPKVLEDVAAGVPGYRARTTCFSDQTVHVASGNRRTVVSGGTPTVGFGAVAYTPLLAVPNVGLLLEVSPSLLPNGSTAILNLQSTLTRWREPGEPVSLTSTARPVEQEGLHAPGATMEFAVDRINLETQHLATTVRLPLGKPVLVGGMSLIPPTENTDHDERTANLYLIVTMTAEQEEAKVRSVR